jgi:hypothetical protein
MWAKLPTANAQLKMMIPFHEDLVLSKVNEGISFVNGKCNLEKRRDV